MKFCILTPFENELSRIQISNSLQQKLFGPRQESTESAADDIQESDDQISVPPVSLVTQSLSEITDKLDEPELRRALVAVMSRAFYLKAKNVGESDSA